MCNGILACQLVWMSLGIFALLSDLDFFCLCRIFLYTWTFYVKSSGILIYCKNSGVSERYNCLSLVNNVKKKNSINFMLPTRQQFLSLWCCTSSTGDYLLIFGTSCGIDIQKSLLVWAILRKVTWCYLGFLNVYLWCQTLLICSITCLISPHTWHSPVLCLLRTWKMCCI